MDVQITQNSGVVVIKLDGRLDFNSSTEISSKLMETVEENKHIVIDMSKCSYVSSSGLRILLVLGKRAKQLGETIVLASLTYDVQDIMEMTGFGSIFHCYDSLDEAVNSFMKNND